MELFADVADDGLRPTGPSTWSSLEPSVFHTVTPGALAAGAESDITETSALTVVSPKLGQDKTLGVFLYRPISLDAAPSSQIQAISPTESPLSAPAPTRSKVFVPQCSNLGIQTASPTSDGASMVSLVLNPSTEASPVLAAGPAIPSSRDRLDDLCDPSIP